MFPPEIYEDTEVKSSGGRLHPDSPVKGMVSVNVSDELWGREFNVSYLECL